MGSYHKPADAATQAPFITTLIPGLWELGSIEGMDTLGQRVKALRTSRQLTQTALADKLKVSQAAISMIENSSTMSLSGEVLAGLCRELVTTPDFLLNGAGSEDGHEAAMQIAELVNIMQKLPPQAREALLDSARTVARAVTPRGTSGDPFATTAPIKATKAKRAQQ